MAAREGAGAAALGVQRARRVWCVLVAGVSTYARRYIASFQHPFSLLMGQLVSFFVISLYVKFVEVRLTAEYGSGWSGHGPIWRVVLDGVRMCGQEVGLFAGLLLAAAAWQRCDPKGGSGTRAAAAALGLLVLPFLSAVEVLGLAHFALFLTPLGPEEVRVIAWTRQVVSAGNVLQQSEVVVGLSLVLAGYYLVPCAVWLPRVRAWQAWSRWQLTVVALAGVLAVIVPQPMVADAFLAPHPLLWLIVGSRPERIWPESRGVAATADVFAGRARFTVRERPTNVLIFILESTRAQSVAVYNAAAPAGRELLRFRDEMVVFDNVYAPVPTSAHAIFSILYGVYPYLGPFWSSAGKVVVADSMAQFFGRAGYSTQLDVTSDLDYDNVRSFAAPGFERVLDPNDWPGQEAFAMLPWGRDDRLLTDEIKRFLSTPRDRPFFLVAMTNNPHHPYALDHLAGPPPVDDPNAPEGKAAYERLVDYNLHLLVELYDWMKERGIADRTLVLVLGDHGEAFGEHPGDFGHAAFIYEENVHIPCVILHPRRLGLPRHIAQLGSQVDLRATILDVLGLHDPAPSDGMSLLHEDPERIVANFTENGVSRFGLRDARFSYIYTPHAELEQVFDRRVDPGETDNIAARAPRITARQRARLQQWDAQHQLSLAKVLR